MVRKTVILIESSVSGNGSFSLRGSHYLLLFSFFSPDNISCFVQSKPFIQKGKLPFQTAVFVPGFSLIKDGYSLKMGLILG